VRGRVSVPLFPRCLFFERLDRTGRSVQPLATASLKANLCFPVFGRPFFFFRDPAGGLGSFFLLFFDDVGRGGSSHFIFFVF